ncbi:MAG TPA: hypothetical protein VE523_11655 [Solirubrobacterales bacterium]|nr:hypothetical protein [Solirubrobacterales bacterium]
MSRFAGSGVGPRLARRRRFEWHLRRVLPWLGRHVEDPNPNAMALVAVETFVRPLPMRMAEYAAWCAGSLRGSPWLETLSVGPAQIQLANWRRLGAIPDVRFTPARFRRVRDRRSSYRVCLELLAEGGLANSPSAAALARCYTGAAETPYVDLLENARVRAVAHLARLGARRGGMLES